ncbi:hypothetical protein [Longimicrobium sp.]|uniref:hypothetical protein n=1 Tax=Longimicrobium sp. TaxID=2029185 RepID=UPI003B3B196F
MSTPARYAEAVVQPVSVAPATSTALVPIAGDRGPRPVPPVEPPTNAHRLFFAMGYAGVALIWTSMWLGGLVSQGAETFAILGVLFTGLGGFGVFIHTIWKPNERKVRHLLLALATLGLTVASYPLVERVSREMYATAAVARLQPLAEALAQDARIRNIGISNASVMLNGYMGPEFGGGSIEGQEGVMLGEVLSRDGISREEYEAVQQRLRLAGVTRAQRTASTVAFYPDGRSGLRLLYVIPGHALPPAHALLQENGTYYSEPLGGPWYMVLDGPR